MRLKREEEKGNVPESEKLKKIEWERDRKEGKRERERVKRGKGRERE